MLNSRYQILVAFAVVFTWGSSQAIGQVTFSAVEAGATDIQSAVDEFRTALGTLNANGPCVGPCVPGVGRREINWDGVPDTSSSPNAFPGDFFNQTSGGRARGIQFSTSGTQLEVSADSDSDNDGNPGPVATLFGNRNPDNAADFAAFSPERIFGIAGSNQMDVTFNVPGEPGSLSMVRGFGAVFTDVELAGSTKLDFYDSSNNLLHSGTVPAFAYTGNDSFKSFSFLGVIFDSPVVSRVHITNGGYDVNLQLLPGAPDDSVAMDDFIYGEPVPEPSALPLMSLACISYSSRRRRYVS